MNKQIEALKMAIEALEKYVGVVQHKLNAETWGDIEDGGKPARNALQACEEALAEAEKQEIGDYEIKAMLDDIEWYQQEQRKLIDRIKELEKKEWQSLSDDEIDEIWVKSFGSSEIVHNLDFARAIEQALKELNEKK